MVDASRPTSIHGVETFHPRERWEDPNLPVDGPAPTLEQVDTFPLHYTAADNLIDGDPGEHAEDLPAFLRAIQRDYEINRGYSIGYGFAVDWLGGVWELRGYDFKNAANRGWNHRTLPVLCLVDGADPLTDLALHSVRALYAEAQRRTGRELHLVGHRDIGATACPGGGIYGQIQLGLIYPLPKEEEEDMEPYVIQPPSGREGFPWFYVLGGAARVATHVDAQQVSNGVVPGFRDESADAIKRYDLLFESIMGYSPLEDR